MTHFKRFPIGNNSQTKADPAVTNTEYAATHPSSEDKDRKISSGPFNLETLKKEIDIRDAHVRDMEQLAEQCILHFVQAAEELNLSLPGMKMDGDFGHWHGHVVPPWDIVVEDGERLAVYYRVFPSSGEKFSIVNDGLGCTMSPSGRVFFNRKEVSRAVAAAHLAGLAGYDEQSIMEIFNSALKDQPMNF